jgi:hypothetical protein
LVFGIFAVQHPKRVFFETPPVVVAHSAEQGARIFEQRFAVFRPAVFAADGVYLEIEAADANFLVKFDCKLDDLCVEVGF